MNVSEKILYQIHSLEHCLAFIIHTASGLHSLFTSQLSHLSSFSLAQSLLPRVSFILLIFLHWNKM